MKSIQQLMLQRWDEYDWKKKEMKEDPDFFSCNEAWEIFYLTNKIQELREDLTKEEIVELIGKCCISETKPLKRVEFLSRIIKELENPK